MKRKRKVKVSHKKIDRHYTVILEPDEGGYHVFCPALQGCGTYGDTLEEAMRNIQEAVTAYCASLRKHGEPLPEEDFIIRPKAVSA